MRIALIGANGQLAHDLLLAWGERPGDEILGLTHAQIEVADLAGVRRALHECRPDLVVNTSAFHKVDVCEDEPEHALAVNVIGPHNLALVCREMECALVHLSTDYVFSGRKGAPYLESDPVDPVNVYGISKAAGEMAIRSLWPKHLIVRSSGLYGVRGSSGKGGNFVETMLRLAGEGRDMRIVDDQVLTPTWTRDLARQIVLLCDSGVWGTYHATCQGACSWYEFTAEIMRLAGLSPRLAPQTTAQSGARATRPSYSVLDNAALRGQGIDVMPAWQESLHGYLELKGLIT